MVPVFLFLTYFTQYVSFIAALFTIGKTWKQSKCPSTDDWIRKMWYIYTMEYYSAIKKDDIMPFAAAWMELENLILSEMTQKPLSWAYIQTTLSFKKIHVAACSLQHIHNSQDMEKPKCPSTAEWIKKM